MLQRFTTIPSGFFTADGERLNKFAYAFLILLCLAFFMPGFATLPPTDRDESLFAQTSKQMIESGNYTDIRFQNEPRYKKPIGIYWLQSISVRLLNPHHLNEIWAYRVPSLIGATLAVVMTACLGALLFGPAVGFLAAIMMAGCLILNVEARLAKTDAALLGSIMVAQYAMARAYIGFESKTVTRGIFFVFWTALAAGILIKGPVILLIVLSTLLWLRWTEKNLTWFGALKPFAGILYTLLLIAPWLAAITLVSNGAFIGQSIGHDFFGKLFQSQGHKFMPAGVYLLAFPFTFFPFALWAFLSVPDIWQKRREPGVRFCIGWIVPSWLVFELVFTKLPHYVMPLYPAIALLAAKAVLDGFPALAASKRLRWLPPLASGIWLFTGAMLLFCAAAMPYLLDHVWNRGFIATALLVMVAQISSLLFFYRRRESGAIVMTAASLVLMINLFGNMLPHLQRMWVAREIIRVAAIVKPCARPLTIASTYNEPSLVFLAGTDTQLLNDGGAIAEAMKKDACTIGVVDEERKPSFLDRFSNAADKPTAIGSVAGIDAGHGKPTELSLYLLPAKKP